MPAHCVSHIPSGRPLWSLLEDVRVTYRAGGGGRLTVAGRWAGIELPDRSPLVREVLHRMSLGPVSLEHVPGLDESFLHWKYGTGDCGPWRLVKQTLDQLGGRVVPSLGAEDGGGPVLSLVAVAPDVVFTLPAVDHDRPMQVRPTTVLDTIDGVPALTCAGMPYQVLLHRPTARAVTEALVERPSTICELAASLRLDVPFVADVVAYLAGGRLVKPDLAVGPRCPSAQVAADVHPDLL